MKRKLVDEIQLFLLKKNYIVKALHYCFDILARKGSRVLLIKVFSDVNSMNNETASEMKRISVFFNASPLIVAEKSGDYLLDNVVYSSFGINVVNIFTFKNSVSGKLPFVKASKHGLVAYVNPDNLKDSMDNGNISTSFLSRKVGVSSKAILRYEKGSYVPIQKARRLHGMFGKEVFDPVDVFSKFQNPEVEIRFYATKKFDNLGFSASDAKKAPFDVMAKKEDELILTKIGDKFDKNLDIVSKLLDADDLVIFNKKKPKEIPALTKDEFLEFKKAKELLKFLKESS